MQKEAKVEAREQEEVEIRLEGASGGRLAVGGHFSREAGGVLEI